MSIRAIFILADKIVYCYLSIPTLHPFKVSSPYGEEDGFMQPQMIILFLPIKKGQRNDVRYPFYIWLFFLFLHSGSWSRDAAPTNCLRAALFSRRKRKRKRRYSCSDSTRACVHRRSASSSSWCCRSGAPPCRWRWRRLSSCRWKQLCQHDQPC